jgi:hypothetical protein
LAIMHKKLIWDPAVPLLHSKGKIIQNDK